jgi:hypothetical protein
MAAPPPYWERWRFATRRNRSVSRIARFGMLFCKLARPSVGVCVVALRGNQGTPWELRRGSGTGSASARYHRKLRNGSKRDTHPKLTTAPAKTPPRPRRGQRGAHPVKTLSTTNARMGDRSSVPPMGGMMPRNRLRYGSTMVLRHPPTPDPTRVSSTPVTLHTHTLPELALPCCCMHCAHRLRLARQPSSSLRAQLPIPISPRSNPSRLLLPSCHPHHGGDTRATRSISVNVQPT